MPDMTTDKKNNKRPECIKIGKRLAEIRKAKGFTQAQLAERLDVYVKLISDYELAKLRLPADMAIRFASILEVTVDDLLGVSGSITSDLQPNRSLNKRMKEIEAMPESQRKFVLRVIDTVLKGVKEE